jgi:hypothetical protein
MLRFTKIHNIGNCIRVKVCECFFPHSISHTSFKLRLIIYAKQVKTMDTHTRYMYSSLLSCTSYVFKILTYLITSMNSLPGWNFIVVFTLKLGLSEFLEVEPYQLGWEIRVFSQLTWHIKNNTQLPNSVGISYDKGVMGRYCYKSQRCVSIILAASSFQTF